ncbi:MAG: helix-turn-helix domain-containing protein [Candidatus Brocadiae bacterium]|nr:helix-turn-helix domain-containing protein [Candidatus Brocadiia bacterium]
MVEQNFQVDSLESKAQDKPWFFEVLPCRPWPYSGECLSGYLLRLAHVNEFNSFWDFIQDIFPMWSVANRISNLRWEYPVYNWGLIPLRTQLSTDYLKKLTMVPLVNKFRSFPVVTRHGLLPPSRFLPNIVDLNLQVCPLCLQEQPFLRLIWRLTSVQVCLQHDCLLQKQCSRCKARLTVLGTRHRHLHCSVCDMDLRMLPVVMAPDYVLMKQNIQQANLQFLLSPDVTLVKLSDQGNEDPRRAIGLKFRYLRLQKEQSMTAMALQLGVSLWQISELELGNHVPLRFYLSYLDKLSISWSEFAALELPHDFVQEQKQPQYKYMNLRYCPTKECPNHYSFSGTRVIILQDLPHRKKAYFLCKDCNRHFTRDYNGNLITKRCKAPRHSHKLLFRHKSAEEIARLKEMGLCGKSNYQIAHSMGWDRRTVIKYWITLDLEEKVLKAQAQRRIQEKQDRYLARCSQVEAILNSLSDQEEEITLCHVGHRLGFGPSALRKYPKLIEHMKQVAQQHNLYIRHRRYELLMAKIRNIIKEMENSNVAMSIQDITRQVCLTVTKFRRNYPELCTMVRQALSKHKAKLKLLHTNKLCLQVNEAASRLAAQGVPMTYKAIFMEAGLQRHYIKYHPALRNLLQQLVSGRKK